jgi:hypothetical protein
MEEAMAGAVHIADPTNAFTFLLECGVTASSVAIDHSKVNLYKRYSSLSVNEKDLYLHMSDEDYKSRFALPANTTMTCVVEFNTILQQAVSTTGRIYKYLTIPKDTRIISGPHVFSTSISIEIRLYPNNSIKVIYDTETNTDLQIRTNVIPSLITTGVENVKWLSFELEVRQLDKIEHNYTVTESVALREKLPYKNQFYKIKVYEKTGDSTEWKRMRITHTEETFDVHTPTCVVHVHEAYLEVFIPPIYTKFNNIGPEVKFIVYTCEGSIEIDYANYSPDEFITELKDLNLDVDESVRAFNATSHFIYTENQVISGRNMLSFEDLKDRVISNNVGINDLPITPGATVTILEDLGYSTIEHLDTMTGRTYLVSNNLFDEPKLDFKSEADITFIDLVESIDSLKKKSTVFDNDTNVTIPPSTLYTMNQFDVDFVHKDIVKAYKELDRYSRTSVVNSGTFRYSPWFYVVRQNEDILELDVYQMDTPKIDITDFREQNNSTLFIINSDVTNIVYKDGNYVLQIHILKDGSLSELVPNDIYSQLSFIPKNESTRLFIEHDSIVSDNEGSFLINFIIGTNMDIRDDDTIIVTNAVNEHGVRTSGKLGIKDKVDLTYGVLKEPPGYQITKMDQITWKRTLTSERYPITMETLHITIGENLKYLWRDIRPLDDGIVYKRALMDIPLLYDRNILDETNGLPFTISDNCDIVTNTLHKEGDPVLDKDGNQIYAYRKGDILKDINGNAIIESVLYKQHKINIMCLSGQFYFSNKEENTNYLNRIYRHIVDKSTKDMLPLIDIVLEHTDIYYKPQDSLGYANAHVDKDTTKWISKEVKLSVIIYVEDTIYANADARELIKFTTKRVIAELFKRKTLNALEIESTLQESYDLGVVSISLDPSETFGLDKDKLLSLKDNSDKLALRKVAFVTPAGEVSVKEDIDITFVNFAIK